MPEKNQAALDFLATRRSHSPKVLTAPVPDRAEVEELLTYAARSPDHGAVVVGEDHGSIARVDGRHAQFPLVMVERA